MLATICLAGCGPSNKARLDAAAVRTAQVNVGRQLPDYPARCRKKHRSGVTPSDREDGALLKTDKALARQHRSVDSCARWYDDTKAGVEGEPKS